MKRLLPAALLALAMLDASAQSTARARPAGTLPLDAPPPPPAIIAEAAPAPALEPEMAQRLEADKVVEEQRINGKVVQQRVTTRNGRTYVLNDYRADGTFTRQDTTLDERVRVPQWTLLEF